MGIPTCRDRECDVLIRREQCTGHEDHRRSINLRHNPREIGGEIDEHRGGSGEGRVVNEEVRDRRIERAADARHRRLERHVGQIVGAERDTGRGKQKEGMRRVVVSLDVLYYTVSSQGGTEMYCILNGQILDTQTRRVTEMCERHAGQIVGANGIEREREKGGREKELGGTRDRAFSLDGCIYQCIPSSKSRPNADT